MRNWILAGLTALLVACSGGGGGDSAQGVDPGPPDPGGPVTPPPPVFPDPAPYAEAEELRANITSVSLNDSDQAVMKFQLTDGRGIAITDLVVDNVRFVIAKLRASPVGALTGNWQSYINQVEEPGIGPGRRAKLQATYERNGEFVNHGDGSYTYTYATSLTDLPADIIDQAVSQGLNLDFEPNRPHRVAIQFDGSNDTANPHYDWVPATGVASPAGMDIAATENCNRCHDPLGVHGGNRREVEYCVTCHNKGSTDANSGNTVDLKVMVHKIHMGANLPSVEAGEDYVIWGFRDSEHNYSNLLYPQDPRNCVNCHVGTGTVGDRDDLVVTSQGDNWAEAPSRAACGSCHDDVVWNEHKGGQTDDLGCAQCHGPGSEYSVVNSHRLLVKEASARFKAQVLEVDNSMPGQIPAVTVKLSDPTTGDAYDVLNDPVFTGSSINVRMAWDTRDYHNTGNDEDDANSIVASLSEATDNGDGSYSVSMPVAIPDGTQAPGIAATGSGVAVVEGRLSLTLEEGGDAERVPLTNAHDFFSIDEPDGKAVERRESVELSRCLACHDTLSLHGSNRTDNIDSCVTCHNPRNTDREVREIAVTPPTDGKDEQSLHFKVLIHGIHAAGIVEKPLQVVGFQGRNTYIYDEETVHFPGNVANCKTCHADGGFTLPLATGVLGTTVDTGRDHQNPRDDTVETPIAAACASCHDDTVAKTHMTQEGGNFATTQAAIDSGAVVETCTVCHGEGALADVEKVHPVHEKPLE